MTNVAFGIPQILSSFLMIIICCLTDCVAAVTLAYEKPEADLMLRPPRNPKKDRLVNTRLIFHAYFFVGLLQCFLSFTMAFWYVPYISPPMNLADSSFCRYMERKGVPFTAMWLKFGTYDPQYDTDYINEVANTASSIYFVNLVIMYVCLSWCVDLTDNLTRQCFNLLATRTRRLSIFQQPPVFNKETQVCLCRCGTKSNANTLSELPSFPSYGLCYLRRFHLLLYTRPAEHYRHPRGACRTLVFTSCLWAGPPDAG